MNRGEAWWADLEMPMGRRPVVLISREDAYAVRRKVTVAPVTTRMHGISAEVELGREDGLPKRCVVNLDGIMTIDKADLGERICALTPTKVAAIDRAIHFALGLRH